MKQTTIYITADNIISSLGFTTKANWENIVAAQTGVECHHDTSIYPSPVWISKIKDETLSEASKALHERTQYSKLRVYAGAEHPHTAQKPEQVDFAAMNAKNQRVA